MSAHHIGRAMRMTSTMALFMSLLACSSPTPPTEWLSMPLNTSTSIAPKAASRLAEPAPRIIRLQRVQIPEYLQTNRVRYRESTATLAEWANARWAERLEVNLTRHLAEELSTHAASATICMETCEAVPTGGTLQVTYVLLDLNRTAKSLHARAQWHWTPASANAEQPRHGEVKWVEPLQDDNAAGQALAMSRANAVIAREIASQLQPGADTK